MTVAVVAADIGHRWIYWPWVSEHLGAIGQRVQEHLVLTAVPVAIGVAVALPLGLLSYRRRWLYPPVLGVGAVLYTIPSLAALAFLLPLTGLSRWTAIVPLSTYTLLILVRNVVTGLDGVQPEVTEAATAMGYSRSRRLLEIELPLALPAIVAGIRIATVTIVGLVPVTALIGQGGLGRFMIDGFQRDYRTPIVVGMVLTVVLAVAFDLVLLGVQRLVTPWARARS